MDTRRTIFSQIIGFPPQHGLRKCIRRYRSDYQVQKFSWFDQFLSPVFMQLIYRESLLDITASLHGIRSKIYRAMYLAQLNNMIIGYD